jgi:hypothetical protein
MKIEIRRMRVIHLSQTRRWIAVLIYLVGGGCFLAGEASAGQDGRFYILAAVGGGAMLGAHIMAARNRRRI